MLELLASPEAWIALFTLIALELVLGIDNIIFISILVAKLPQSQQEAARRTGLFLAMFMRLGLLMTLAWIVGLTAPLFSIMGWNFAGRDIVLIAGGLFLLWKSVGEIHQTFEGAAGKIPDARPLGFSVVIMQIMAIDLVFSLDSIITAVGMVDQLAVMMTAVVASVGLMMFFARPIGNFVAAHPTIKMLALSFLIVISVMLIADGFGHHVPKGYIYSAMAFSVVVEMLNIRLRKRALAASAERDSVMKKQP
jgi:predicted tellurium resistance membrane protein TerC